MINSIPIWQRASAEKYTKHNENEESLQCQGSFWFFAVSFNMRGPKEYKRRLQT